MADSSNTTKPYYDEGGITIYHGDCLDVLPTLAGESVDIAVTSPPYNMGLIPGGNGRGMYRPGANNKGGRFRAGYDELGDALEQEKYDEWQRSALMQMWSVIRLGIFYNHRPRVEHGVVRLPLSMDFDDLPLRQIIIWDRGTGIDVNLRHFCTRQEWILLFAKPDFALVDHGCSGMGDVWRETPAHVDGHPAPFPLAIPTRALTATGAESVLDPFMGSGTTLRAAKNLGREAIGIEQSERYCEIAARRLGQEVLDFEASRG